MPRRRAVLSARLHTLLLLAALPWLVQCAGAGRGRLDATPLLAPAPPSAAAPSGEGVHLAPDPTLQALLDPYPAAAGPSWLGGDVASSIRLADDRWVWIFGDTILGEVRARCAGGAGYCGRLVAGPGAGMIANSAGTMVRSADGRLSPVVKYWRTDAGGAPAPIFTVPEEGFLWPLAGVRVGQVLLVAANRHTLASGLLPVDNVLLRVWNPDAPPDAWIYDAHPLPGFRPGSDAAPILSWTTALLARGNFVYLLGSRDVGLDARAVLARLDAAAISDREWTPEPEYLEAGVDGAPSAWRAALDPGRLYVIDGLPGSSEASIDAAPGIGWYTFQIPPLHYEVHLYTASDLLGPWVDRGAAYALPAAWRATQGDCPDPERARAEARWDEVAPACAPRYAAYAPKAHPVLAPQGGFALSYNVNTWGGSLEAAVQALQTLHGFYVPQLLSGMP